MQNLIHYEKMIYGIFPEFILSRFKNPTTKIFDQYFIFEIETRHNFFVGGICIRHFTHKCTDIHLHLYTHTKKPHKDKQKKTDLMKFSTINDVTRQNVFIVKV